MQPTTVSDARRVEILLQLNNISGCIVDCSRPCKERARVSLIPITYDAANTAHINFNKDLVEFAGTWDEVFEQANAWLIMQRLTK